MGIHGRYGAGSRALPAILPGQAGHESRRRRQVRGQRQLPGIMPLVNSAGTSQPTTQHMQCMEVWGGSQLTAAGVEFGGLDAWVYSKPYGAAHAGGDVYYASSCATGRISRLLLADVSGHGSAVASIAADLR